MKFLNRQQPIYKPCWFRCQGIISGPSNKILQLIPIHSTIFNATYQILLITINLYWRGRKNPLPDERSIHHKVQK
jgi:hypothetical protein